MRSICVRSFRHHRSRREQPPPLFSRVLLATVAMSVIYAGSLIGGMLGALIGIPLGLAAGIAAILCWASRPGDG